MSGVSGLPASDSLTLRDVGPAEVFFEAQWTPQNMHLREKMFWEHDLSDILKALFTNPFFVPNLLLKGLISPLIGRVVIMSRNFSGDRIQNAKAIWDETWINPTHNRDDLRLRKYYEAIPLRMMTPDHAMITGTFYRARKAERGQDVPTIITAQPNAVLYKERGVQNWLLRRGCESSEIFNVVAWDYRGTGESEGSGCSSNQIVLDAETVHQCVNAHFGISEDNIPWYGRSIGGAPATQVRAIHQNYTTPDGVAHESHAPCVNMLSFNSLTDIIEHTDYAEYALHFAVEFIDRLSLPDCMISILQYILSTDFIKAVARWLLSITDWEFNVPAAMQEIRREDLLVVCDVEDEIIQNAGAQRSAREEQILMVTSDQGHHMAPEESMVDGYGRLAADRILAQLLRR